MIRRRRAHAFPLFHRSGLGEKDGPDHLVRLIIGHSHHYAGARVTEVALERQARGEGGAAEHRHQVLRDSDGRFSTHHLRLNIRQERRRSARVGNPGGGVQQRSGRLDLRAHLRYTALIHRTV